MKKKNREKLSVAVKIGAGVLALVMIVGIVFEAFMCI